MFVPSKKRPRPPNERFTVGWISALPLEYAAAIKLLDEEYEENKERTQTLGRIAHHYIVIACLPAGQPGTNSAAASATRLQSEFPSIQCGMAVGIGGGVPSAATDIRLGDFVVSQPQNGYGGVVQYDSGKTGPGGKSIRTGSLTSPPRVLLEAMSQIQARHYLGKRQFTGYLSTFDRTPKFTRKHAGPDVLFEATYNHVDGPSCSRCRKDKIVKRVKQRKSVIIVHYGVIASDNQVMKDGATRDRISSSLDGVTIVF